MTSIVKKILHVLEAIFITGIIRESFLLILLKIYYNSKFRQIWLYSEEKSHHELFRHIIFHFGYTNNPSPYQLLSGFYILDVLQENVKVLDIGCGDGFFSRSILTTRAKKIDAIDIDELAIQRANNENPHPKITYYLLDGTTESFPDSEYDLIILNGVIGHLTIEGIHALLEKITAALKPNGIFVGSESLKNEGHDHLTFFEDESHLEVLFKQHFSSRVYNTQEYPLPYSSDYQRSEVFWRCSSVQGDIRRLQRWQASDES